jgi:hypothetical protein
LIRSWVTRCGGDAQPVLQQAVSEGYRGIPPKALIAGTIDEVAAGAGYRGTVAYRRSVSLRSRLGRPGPTY